MTYAIVSGGSISGVFGTVEAADTNHDGAVNVEDLVHVISVWGARP